MKIKGGLSPAVDTDQIAPSGAEVFDETATVSDGGAPTEQAEARQERADG